MPSRRDFLRTVLLSTGTAMLTACAGAPRKTPVFVALDADEGLNPNAAGDPSPIVVIVYELRGLRAFSNAGYFDLVDDPTRTLGADLVSSRELEIVPGQKHTYDHEVSSEATHVGVVAGFRDIGGAKWRDSVELDREKKNELIIHLTGLAVTLQKMKRRQFGIF